MVPLTFTATGARTHPPQYRSIIPGGTTVTVRGSMKMCRISRFSASPSTHVDSEGTTLPALMGLSSFIPVCSSLTGRELLDDAVPPRTDASPLVFGAVSPSKQFILDPGISVPHPLPKARVLDFCAHHPPYFVNNSVYLCHRLVVVENFDDVVGEYFGPVV